MTSIYVVVVVFTIIKVVAANIERMIFIVARGFRSAL